MRGESPAWMSHAFANPAAAAAAAQPGGCSQVRESRAESGATSRGFLHADRRDEKRVEGGPSTRLPQRRCV